MTLRELHLFAGIGGGILGGMLLGHRCVGAVEIDPYCRRVLEARQRDGILEQFPATWRRAAPRLSRLVSGHAARVESRKQRTHAAGNAQVPAVAAAAFVELMARLA